MKNITTSLGATARAKLLIPFDAMQDGLWIEHASADHESQIRRLDALFATQSRTVHE